MPASSASNASPLAIQSSGGNITHGVSIWVWILGAIVALFWLRRKKKNAESPN